VQDYTAAQLLLLFALFPKANITLAGDENQAIFNTALESQEIKDLLIPLKRPMAAYQLVNSYRSSKEITCLFQTLVNDPHHLKIVAIRPDGPKPCLTQCENEADYLEVLTKMIADLPISDTGAIITKNQAEQKVLVDLLETIKQPSKNWQILSIDMAKGMEFDQINVHIPSAERYCTECAVKFFILQFLEV